MSITTWGWGSANITTIGFGGYGETVIIYPVPEMAARSRETSHWDVLDRLKPAVIDIRDFDITQITDRSWETLGYRDWGPKLIATRYKDEIITRDKGSISVRSKDSVGTRSKPSPITKRQKP